MAMQYYTLEEAARMLNVSPDELKLMSRRGKPRPFKDGGTFQFRVSEIDEMARERGVRSDPELTLREAQPKRRTSEVKRPASEERTLPPPDVRKKSKLVRSEDPTLPPPSAPKRKSEAKGPKAGEEVFDFDLAAEEVDLGRNKPGGTGKSGTKIGGPSGSDSDVRLVPDGSEIDIEVASDSDPRNLNKGGAKKKPGSGEKQRDSSVKLVGEAPSDSDVKLIGESASSEAVNLDPPKSKTASDSDVRLELPKGAPGKGKGKGKRDLQITEEIDLDAEQEDSDQKQGALRPPSSPVLPTGSPFELASSKPKSDELIPLVPDDRAPAAAKRDDAEGSDEFELSVEDSALEKGKPTPPGSSDELPTLGEGSEISRPDGSSDLELSLEDSSPVGDLEASPPSETEESSSEFELSLDPETGAAKSSESTEDSSSEFELSLDEAAPESTGESDSSSEFELSLEDGAAAEGGDASSEFELSLDEADEPSTTSDSEFDLTLEPGSSDELEEALAEGKELADVEESEGAPAAEKDIFETDFDVPTLEEESGSEAVPIDEADTDLDETSDFNVAIDDDLASEEESGSQVVALEDEEEADDAAATVSRKAADEEEIDEDSEIVDEEEAAVAGEGRREPAVSTKPAKVRWGPIPAIFMIPTVILTFFVGLMCWETLSLMWGNHQGQKVSGVITPWLAYDVFGLEKPEGGK